jgi:hypothetical protein
MYTLVDFCRRSLIINAFCAENVSVDPVDPTQRIYSVYRKKLCTVDVSVDAAGVFCRSTETFSAQNVFCRCCRSY